MIQNIIGFVILGAFVVTLVRVGMCLVDIIVDIISG